MRHVHENRLQLESHFLNVTVLRPALFSLLSTVIQPQQCYVLGALSLPPMAVDHKQKHTGLEDSQREI